MPKKFIDPKKASHFKLVHKSVEDPTFEDKKTEGVLVRQERVGNRRTRGPNDINILREEMFTMDMQNPDDTAEPGLFEGMDECDFDQDFIQQMMMAPDGEEEEEDDGMADYPRHEERREADDELETLLRKEYQQHQCEMEEGDPRADGPLPAEQYVPAFQDLVTDQARDKFSILPQRQQEQLRRHMPSGDGLFHENHQGQFLTVIRGKRDLETEENWQDEEQRAKADAVERLRTERAQFGGARGADEVADDDAQDECTRDQYEYIKVREKPQEKWDCQTVLTTLSTLENHPTVIPTESKRIRLRRGVPVADQGRLTARALTRLGEEGAAGGPALPPAPADAASSGSAPAAAAAAEQEGGERSQLQGLRCVLRSGALSEAEYSEARARVLSAADDASLGEDSLVTVYDTAAGRPRNEDPEQKKARKKQVKEDKRVKREAKKELKTAYRAETIRARYVGPHAKQQRAMLSLA